MNGWNNDYDDDDLCVRLRRCSKIEIAKLCKKKQTICEYIFSKKKTDRPTDWSSFNNMEQQQCIDFFSTGPSFFLFSFFSSFQQKLLKSEFVYYYFFSVVVLFFAQWKNKSLIKKQNRRFSFLFFKFAYNNDHYGGEYT